ncbi:MAG: ABC transporter ATP-binding protein [Candidatus Coatesbacteria bacterium]|nr:ABC transporter ATP-binding protein [Candidatus Coatesbacteria bacterium]
MKDTVIRADKLTKVYELPAEKIVALKEIDLDVRPGEFLAIMGPSGAGKTTLLNLIGCLDGPTSGSIRVLDQELASLKERQLVLLRRKNIGFVFQDFFLVSSLTALENVQLPLVFARLQHGKGRAAELLESVGLGHRLNHLPHELSGGEMQRVAVARALATSPQILLADEPSGNLDTRNARSIFDLFRRFNEGEGVTVLVATHNTRLAHAADRIVHLADGRIESEEVLNHG